MASYPIETIRHTLSHVMATAVQRLYPEVKFGIGPAVDDGFYYDFDTSHSFSEEDFGAIEKEMRSIINKKIPVEQTYVPINQAISDMQKAGQTYKVELLEDIKHGKRPAISEEDVEQQKDGKISFYTIGLPSQGGFTDLCKGPHVTNTKELPADGFKISRVAGAYWRGKETNPQLQRIYAYAFTAKNELNEHLAMIEEAKKRDHRKLGKHLDLFAFSELVGSGFPLFTPKGALVRRLLNEYIEELQRNAGYTQVWTPQIAKAELFKTSGHYDKYKGDMFHVVSNYSDEEFFLKPMNCPQHTQIYASQPRSYRDLPLRYTDFAMLYRDEKPGELNGLARVRSFSQDDCHIFCREDQVDEEIDIALAMTKKVLEGFGFKYRYRLSTRDPEHPEKYIGDPKTWEKAEKWAEKIMKRNKIDYFDGPGEAAFYAPKMDLMATDALGREWQLSTIQIDYFMPERFDLSYIDDKGQKIRPVMIHRAIIGSSERFMMVLLEHYAGALPLWLSPVQVAILPISDKFNEHARTVQKQLIESDVRVELHDENESVGKKIRNVELMKIPYIAVIGEKEVAAGAVAVRKRGIGDTGAIPLAEFIERVTYETASRS